MYIYGMGNLKRYDQKIGYAQLDGLIETLGDKGLMSFIVEKLSRGIKPSLIASDLQVPFMVLWEWLEADPARQRAYNAGWEMFASDMHAETVSIADEAILEEVPLAKLRIETRFKAASSYDRKRFGAKLDVEVSNKISVMDALSGARGRVEAGGRVGHIAPVTYDHEPVRVGAQAPEAVPATVPATSAEATEAAAPEEAILAPEEVEIL
jgi:hypothetical protein